MISLDSYVKWVKAHERLVIVAMVLALGAFGFSKWADKSAADAQAKAATAIQVAAVQHDADVKIAAAVAQQTALFNAAQQQHEQEIAQLVEAVASRDAASAKQISVVTQPKTTPEAVADLNAAYGATLPTPLTAEQAGSIPVVDLQQFTVAKIQATTLQGDLADTRKELDTTSQGLTQATALVGALQNQVTGLQTEIKDNDVAAKNEIAAIKKEARKDKIKWFKRGFIVGFLGGLFGGHAVGF